MLGGVKGDPGAEDIPLFRLLARRWKSLAPLQRERIILLSTPKDQPRRTRRWTVKRPPAIYANQEAKPAVSKRAWNPWLWIK